MPEWVTQIPLEDQAPTACSLQLLLLHSRKLPASASCLSPDWLAGEGSGTKAHPLPQCRTPLKGHPSPELRVGWLRPPLDQHWKPTSPSAWSRFLPFPTDRQPQGTSQHTSCTPISFSELASWETPLAHSLNVVTWSNSVIICFPLVKQSLFIVLCILKNWIVTRNP